MTPYIVIAVAAIVGFVGWGLDGALVAGVVAWMGNLLIGLTATWISGGFLPRQVRAKAARTFLEHHQDIADTAFPKLNAEEKQKAIEAELERLCTAAAQESSVRDTGLEWKHMMAAGGKLLEKEEDPARQQLLVALSAHLYEIWHSAAARTEDGQEDSGTAR